MHDDTFCVFVILACILTLIMPEPGQVIVAVFSFAVAVLAVYAPATDSSDGHHEHRDRHDVAGY